MGRPRAKRPRGGKTGNHSSSRSTQFTIWQYVNRRCSYKPHFETVFDYVFLPLVDCRSARAVLNIKSYAFTDKYIQSKFQCTICIDNLAWVIIMSNILVQTFLNPLPTLVQSALRCIYSGWHYIWLRKSFPFNNSCRIWNAEPLCLLFVYLLW